MAKYSIFINRVKCIETTSGAGKDEISCISFFMDFTAPNLPTINTHRFEVGNFSAGKSIWLPDKNKYLIDAEKLDDLNRTMFFLLLYERDTTPEPFYVLEELKFPTWFAEKAMYYAAKYDFSKPDQWRKKFINATYNRLKRLFSDSTDNSKINDDDLIDVRRILVTRDDLDYVWKSKPGTRKEKNYTFTGDGGKYKAQIFIYGYHG